MWFWWLLPFLILALWSPPAWAAPELHKLSNGLTVIIDENHEAPVAAFQVWVRAGSAYEGPKERGITHLIEHMIFKGTPSRPAGEMAGQIEALGGEVNAYTTLDHTNYYVVTSSTKAGDALDILADAVVNASFEPKELSREKEVVVEEIRMNLDNPDRRRGWAAMKLIFGDHPYGRPVIGSIASVRAITRQDILNYRAKWYRGPGMVVVAVGDFSAKDILARIKKDFAGVSPQTPPKFTLPPVKTPPGPRLLVMRDKVAQAHLSLMWLTPGLPSPAVYPLDMASAVLGGGETSRLWSQLKEKDGLVDSVDASAYTPDQVGMFEVDASLSPDKVLQAWPRLLAQTMELMADQPRPSELSRARVSLAAEFIRDRQTMSGQANTLGYFQMFRGGYEMARTYLARFQAVDAAQVASQARRTFTPQGLAVVIQLPEGAPAPDQAQLAAEADRLARKLAATPATRPQAQMHVLDNGLKVIIKPQHAVPLVGLVLATPRGQAALDPQTQGLASLWARSLTRGSEGLTYEDLTRELEDMAASLSGFSGRDTSGVTGSFLSQDWKKGLELLARVWFTPQFPAEQVTRAKAEQAAAQRAQEDHPIARAAKRFRKLIYGAHPYGLDPLGTPETLASFQPAELAKFHQSLVGPGGLVLSVVGDVEPELVLAEVRKLFGAHKGQVTPTPDLPVPALTTARASEVAEPQAKQTQILLGWVTPGRIDPRRHALRLLEADLGGMGGALFQELRDKLSLAYAVQPFFDDYREGGVFGVYMGVGPGKEKQALAGLGSELQKARDKAPAAADLARAKAYVLGQEAMGQQTYGAQALTMALDELAGLGYLYHLKEPQELSAVDAQEVLAVTREFLRPAGRALLTMGPDNQAGAPAAPPANRPEPPRPSMPAHGAPAH
ncbi:MAG: insulinase family protein [Deltaproteobacteria bacterium]|nr:insulinase family protein [Deltaproteobacteria bacterium]